MTSSFHAQCSHHCAWTRAASRVVFQGCIVSFQKKAQFVLRDACAPHIFCTPWGRGVSTLNSPGSEALSPPKCSLCVTGKKMVASMAAQEKSSQKATPSSPRLPLKSLLYFPRGPSLISSLISLLIQLQEDQHLQGFYHARKGFKISVSACPELWSSHAALPGHLLTAPPPLSPSQPAAIKFRR